MKKFLLACGLLAGFSSVAFAKTTYTLDARHSFVEYDISHFGTSFQSGKWFASGTIVLDEKDMQKSSAQITIDMNSLATGLASLDTHLKSPDFFDVEKYPTATFASKKVSKMRYNQFKLDGILTLHGVSKPVSLVVTQNGIIENPMTKKEVAGFSATATISRTDFGISYGPQAIADTVTLDIEVEASPSATQN